MSNGDVGGASAPVEADEPVEGDAVGAGEGGAAAAGGHRRAAAGHRHDAVAQLGADLVLVERPAVLQPVQRPQTHRHAVQQARRQAPALPCLHWFDINRKA